MDYHPYAVGTEVCNIFWPDDDCQTVSESGIQAHLQGGESKIFLPKTSPYFSMVSFQDYDLFLTTQ